MTQVKVSAITKNDGWTEVDYDPEACACCRGTGWVARMKWDKRIEQKRMRIVKCLCERHGPLPPREPRSW